jgi:hypothetical protein
MLDIFAEKVSRFYHKIMRKLVIFVLIAITNFISINSVFFEDNVFVRAVEPIGSDELGVFYPIVKNLPAIGPLWSTFEFAVYVGMNSDVWQGEDALTVITGLAGLVFSGALDPTGGTDGGIRKSFQETFHTNQYCSDQVIYREEQQYVSKNGGGRPNNGYNIFPAYPIKMVVKNNQCDYPNNFIGETFKRITISVDSGEPDQTKCSYSYTSEHTTCFADGLIPLIVEDYTMQVTAELIMLGPCANPQGSNETAAKQSKLKTIVKALANIALYTARGLMVLFGTSFFQDPYTYTGIASLTAGVGFMLRGLPKMASYGMMIPPRIDCIVATLITYFAHILVMEATIMTWQAVGFDGWGGSTYGASEVIKEVTFCGHDWLSYNKQTFDLNNYLINTGENGEFLDVEEAKILPTKGVFANSRYKKIINCIEKNQCDAELNENYCPRSSNLRGLNGQSDTFCEGVVVHSKDVRNRNYREYLYGGKEYFVGGHDDWTEVSRWDRLDANADEGDAKKWVNFISDIEKDKSSEDNRTQQINYDVEYCIDPRLPEDKGYYNLAQAYYMRGNDKASFACGRYYYYSERNGCILPFSDLDRADTNSNICSGWGKYSYCNIRSTDTALFAKYLEKCKVAFEKARECCEARSRNFICLELKSRKKYSEGTFCFANVVTDNYEQGYDSLLSYFMSSNDDDRKVTCIVKHDGEKYGEYEATKKAKTDKVCVISTNFCPYNFRLNAGINYRASFCDSASLEVDVEGEENGAFQRKIRHFNRKLCEGGNFGINDNNNTTVNSRTKIKEAYTKYATSFDFDEIYSGYVFDKVATDMANFNNKDFEYLYNFNKLTSSKVERDGIENGSRNITYQQFRSGSNGNYNKIKNFCQYSAHCTTVESEFDSYGKVYNFESLFLDSSCGGSSNYSRAGNSAGLSKLIAKQLTVPVVECIYESLINLVKGVTGNSLCNNGYVMNADGYCGTDTKEYIKEIVDANNLSYLSQKYQKVQDEEGVEHFIIKGYKLPPNYNPFVKLQKALTGIMQALFSIFIVLFFFRSLMEHDKEEGDFIEHLKVGAFTSKILTFSIVMWLCVGSGIRDVVFDKVIDFSMGFYDLSVSIFSAAIPNPHNMVLKQDEVARYYTVQQNLDTGSATHTLCFKRSVFGTIAFVELNSFGMCPSGYNIRNKIAVYTGGSDNETIESRNVLISSNTDVEILMYYIDNFNKNTSEKLSIVPDSEREPFPWNEYYDGCYFDVNEYPEGKSYLSLFDTLDCKLTRYLGFTAGGVPNLIGYSGMMLFLKRLVELEMPFISKVLEYVQKFLGILGQLLFSVLMTFFFSILTVVINIVFNFLSAFLTLSILMFLTPIVLPFILFERTKKIANNWIEKIIGTATAPIINIVMTMVFVNILDMVLLGGAINGTEAAVKFAEHSANGRSPKMLCSGVDNTNVLCFLGEIPIFGQLVSFFEDGFAFTLLMNLIVAIAIVKCGDELISSLESFVGKFITFGGSNATPNNVQPMKISDSSSKADAMAKKAIGVGESLSYMPGYLADRGLEKLEHSYQNRMDISSKTHLDDDSYDISKGMKQKRSEISDLRKQIGADERKLKNEGGFLGDSEKEELTERVEKSKSKLKKLESEYNETRIKAETQYAEEKREIDTKKENDKKEIAGYQEELTKLEASGSELTKSQLEKKAELEGKIKEVNGRTYATEHDRRGNNITKHKEFLKKHKERMEKFERRCNGISKIRKKLSVMRNLQDNRRHNRSNRHTHGIGDRFDATLKGFEEFAFGDRKIGDIFKYDEEAREQQLAYEKVRKRIAEDGSFDKIEEETEGKIKELEADIKELKTKLAATKGIVGLSPSLTKRTLTEEDRLEGELEKKKEKLDKLKKRAGVWKPLRDEEKAKKKKEEDEAKKEARQKRIAERKRRAKEKKEAAEAAARGAAEPGNGTDNPAPPPHPDLGGDRPPANPPQNPGDGLAPGDVPPPGDDNPPPGDDNPPAP